MQVGLKTWQYFKDHFSQEYTRYHICKKATAAAHGYREAANHIQEIDAQVSTLDALQSLACAAMEDKEAMADLTSINLTLYQILTQAQGIILVVSKQLQTLQTKSKAKTQTTERPVLDKNTKEDKSKCYLWTHGGTRILDHTSANYQFPKSGYQVGSTLGGNMGGSDKFNKKKAHELDGGARNTVVDKINYNHHISLIRTLPTSST